MSTATIEITVTRDGAPNVTMRDVFQPHDCDNDDCPDRTTVTDHIDALVASVKRAMEVSP